MNASWFIALGVGLLVWELANGGRNDPPRPSVPKQPERPDAVPVAPRPPEPDQNHEAARSLLARQFDMTFGEDFMGEEVPDWAKELVYLQVVGPSAFTDDFPIGSHHGHSVDWSSTFGW